MWIIFRRIKDDREVCVMEKRKIEAYDDGYSRSDVVKRLTAAASALLLCGSLTACHRVRPEPDDSVMGDMLYIPDVSESDISSEDELSVMGEEQYFPVEDDISSESYMGDMTVAPSGGK